MSKLLELVINIVMWVALALFCVTIGWMLRAYKARKDLKA